jgi:hypothetical protein
MQVLRELVVGAVGAAGVVFHDGFASDKWALDTILSGDALNQQDSKKKDRKREKVHLLRGRFFFLLYMEAVLIAVAHKNFLSWMHAMGSTPEYCCSYFPAWLVCQIAFFQQR